MKGKKVIKYLACAYLVIFSFNNLVLADSIDCKSMGDFRTDIQNLFNFLKIILPLLVIVLSTYDFIRAITAKDEKDVKKAFQKLLKRFACAVILFILPTILNLLLDLLGIGSSVCIE